MRERNIDTPRSDSNYDYGSAAGEAEYQENLKKQRDNAEKLARDEAKQARINDFARDALLRLNKSTEKDKPNNKKPRQENMFQ